MYGLQGANVKAEVRKRVQTRRRQYMFFVGFFVRLI
jgi:hypothetical protein